MGRESTIKAQSIRSCIARRVRKWDKEKTKERLYAGKCEGQFRLIESDDWPANETWSDVAFDSDTLYVSVMALEAGNQGLLIDGFGRDADVIEVFFDPFCDRIGYHQYIAGSDGLRTENSHWPYRDAKTHMYRDPAWEVGTEEEVQRPDVVRFTFFRFDLEAVRASDCIGFNVGRTQSRISESSSWNLVSGIGFCDAGCFGRLWFRQPPVACASAQITTDRNQLKSIALDGLKSRRRPCALGARLIDPCGQTVAAWKPRAVKERLCLRAGGKATLRESGRYRLVVEGSSDGKAIPVEPTEFTFDHQGTKKQPFQFQATYDWPDNFGNVPYSPADLEREMQWYRDCGLDRIYWLDYSTETWMGKRRHRPGHWSAHIEKSYRMHGQDFLWSAVEAAHKAGQEFITIFKPFDLMPDEAFIKQNPQCQIRRNPKWARKPKSPIRSLRLYQCDERPFPFKKSQVRLWQSRNNRQYDLIRSRYRVKESIVERPEAVWSPRGLVSGGGTTRVRCLSIDGLNVSNPYLALSVADADAGRDLRNRAYLVAELVDEDGNSVPYIVDCREQAPDGGFDFGPRKANEASWARLDVGLERMSSVRGTSLAIGLSTRQETYVPGFLEPSFPEVREFWLGKLRRGIDAGADGISIRIAHHVGCVDWLSYMYAEPVLEEFRSRAGRDPEPRNEDYTLIRRIRGDFYTELVREASRMAHDAGRKFQHHLENRMLVPPEYDCYSQIHWDWRTWIREGLVDEVDLKYIGAEHPDCYREILPFARQHGVKVNAICADPDPRSKPRSIHEGPLFLRRAREAGLNGINLYELWIYRRMTDRGHPMTRGSGEAIIREMRAHLDEMEGR